MNKQILLSQLSQFDIDETEALIYLYLLENGPSTPLQLSRAINIDRSKVYRAIEHLTKKHFLEESHAAWGKKLQAASPNNIAQMVAQEEESLQARKQALPELINELSSIPVYSKREFEVKHYRGQEGLRQMLWNQLAAKDQILAFSYKNKNDIAGKTYAEKVRREQIGRKITLYEVENETDQGDYWYTNIDGWPDFYKSRHISPKALDIKQYIAVFNHTVAIMNWHDDEEIGLEIVNETYANMERQRFWKFWEIAGASSGT